MKAYRVYISTGEYGDYFEDSRFITLSEDYAIQWVNKYNRLIKDYESFLNYKSDSVNNFSGERNIWSSRLTELVVERPIANFEEVELRLGGNEYVKRMFNIISVVIRQSNPNPLDYHLAKKYLSELRLYFIKSAD